MEQPNTELRVLSGTHAGARLPLINPVIVGSHQNCDIVLADPGIQPRHVRITLADAQWIIASIDDTTIDEKTLALGEQFWLSTTAITVDKIDALWPTNIEPPQKTTQAAAEKTTPLETAAQDGLVVETALPSLKKMATSSQNVLVTFWQKNSHAIIMVLSLLLLSIAGILAADAIQSNALRHKKSQNINQERVIHDRCLTILRAHHFDNLQISVNQKHEVTITGWVDTPDALYHVQRLFLDFTPRVTVLPYVYRTFQQEVSNVVAKNGAGITVHFGTPGTVLLAGYGTEIAITHLVDTLVAAVPSIQKIHTEDIQRPPQISAAFYDHVRAAGLKNIDFFFDGHSIHAHGTLASAQITQWEALLVDFQKKYGHLVPVEAIIDEMPDIFSHNGDGRASATRAPVRNEYGAYGIHSVVGGLNKYIITQDGRIVTIGGRIGPFRLKDITLKTIILDGPQHLTINR